MILPYYIRQAGSPQHLVEKWLLFVNDPSDPRHGTKNGYGNLACRCTACRAANVKAVQAARESRKTRIPADRHGRQTTYFNWGCRCEICTRAKRFHRDLLPGVNQ